MSNAGKFIKLPEEQVHNKTGIFLNRLTGAVWELCNQDGKLIVSVPNFSFQMAPLTTTKFIPVNTQVNLEFEFEKPNQNKPLLMHIYAKGIKRATFEAQ